MGSESPFQFLKGVFIKKGSNGIHFDHGQFRIKTFPIYAPPKMPPIATVTNECRALEHNGSCALVRTMTSADIYMFLLQTDQKQSRYEEKVIILSIKMISQPTCHQCFTKKKKSCTAHTSPQLLDLSSSLTDIRVRFLFGLGQSFR